MTVVSYIKRWGPPHSAIPMISPYHARTHARTHARMHGLKWLLWIIPNVQDWRWGPPHSAIPVISPYHTYTHARGLKWPTFLCCSGMTVHHDRPPHTGGRWVRRRRHHSAACSLAPPCATHCSGGRTARHWRWRRHCTTLQLSHQKHNFWVYVTFRKKLLLCVSNKMCQYDM